MKKYLFRLSLVVLCLLMLTACADKPTTPPTTKEEMEVYKAAWGDVLRELDALDAEVRAAIGEEVYAGTVIDHYSGDPQHYLYLTDLDAAPKIKNKRFHLVEVKYAEKQLLEFQKQLSAHYAEKGLAFFSTGLATKDNAVRLTLPTGTDTADLDGIVPLDAVKITFADEMTVEDIAE